MNIQARKNEFVEEFLKIQNEDIIKRIALFLKMEKESNVKPMSIDELNDRIDQSEQDFKNNKFKTNSELLKKYK